MPKILSGFTTCPYCTLTGLPQEPYMAVPTDDGRVFCYSCKRVTSDLSRTSADTVHTLRSQVALMVQSAVIALMSTDNDAQTYHLVTAGQKGLGFHQPPTDHDSMRAAAAVAQGNAEVLLSEAERVEVLLAHGPYAFHTVRISYLPNELRFAHVEGNGVEGHEAILARLQGPEKHAFESLGKLGFTPVLNGTDFDSALRRLPMVKGQGGKGIRAEIAWIVS